MLQKTKGLLSINNIRRYSYRSQRRKSETKIKSFFGLSAHTKMFAYLQYGRKATQI